MDTTTVGTTSVAAGASGDSYRFDHPRIADILNDMYIRADELGPGDVIGPFDLHTTDGTVLNSADLARRAQPVLLVFGSRTCPVTEDGADGLRNLHAQYGDQVRFVMIQVREAHPGSLIGQPKTFGQKLRHAVDLKAHHQLPFEVAVDDIDGTFHRWLGARPNSAYLIDPTGVIVFRAQWANQSEAIGEALHAVTAGRTPARQAVTRTPQTIMRMLGHVGPVLDAAGAGARLDTWKVAPPMAMMMTVADLFAFLPRSQRGLPAMALTIGAIGMVIGAAIRLWA
ncbi:MAG: peroxiredoxin family protein [Vicinamibacterales bacterium]